jgi:ribosomal protein L12E/L44/L45/RPP1/RPP2
MPLEKSSTNDARNRNIAEMIHAGHPPKVAEAAAYANQRKEQGHAHHKEREAHERRKYGK